MVEKKGYSKTIVAVFIVLFFVNLVAHILFFGTGINSLLPDGINQIVLGSKAIEVAAYADIYSGLKIYSFGLMSFYIVFVLFVLSKKKKSKKDSSEEIVKLKRLKSKYSKTKNQTELDVLYKMLKDKKKLNTTFLDQIFDVDEETINDWIETLEMGGLAELNKKKLGKPELVLKKE